MVYNRSLIFPLQLDNSFLFYSSSQPIYTISYFSATFLVIINLYALHIYLYMYNLSYICTLLKATCEGIILFFLIRTNEKLIILIPNANKIILFQEELLMEKFTAFVIISGERPGKKIAKHKDKSKRHVRKGACHTCMPHNVQMYNDPFST